MLLRNHPLFTYQNSRSVVATKSGALTTCNNMPFKPGNQEARKRKIRGGGPPTKEQLAERESFRQALERKREERAEELATAYYDMALGTRDETATMRHVVDKVIPPIEKHEHSGEVGVRPWVVDAYEPKKKK
jgi:hypothetical protein